MQRKDFLIEKCYLLVAYFALFAEFARYWEAAPFRMAF
ncbi:hypothetical protein [Azospirillum melinis]